MDTTGWRRNIKDDRILGRFHLGRWQGMPLKHIAHHIQVQTRMMTILVFKASRVTFYVDYYV